MHAAAAAAGANAQLLIRREGLRREGQKMRAEIACSRRAGHDNDDGKNATASRDGPITIGTMTTMTNTTVTVVLEEQLEEEEEKRNFGSAFEKKQMHAIARHIVRAMAAYVHKYVYDGG